MYAASSEYMFDGTTNICSLGRENGTQLSGSAPKVDANLHVGLDRGNHVHRSPPTLTSTPEPLPTAMPRSWTNTGRAERGNMGRRRVTTSMLDRVAIVPVLQTATIKPRGSPILITDYQGHCN